MIAWIASFTELASKSNSSSESLNSIRCSASVRSSSASISFFPFVTGATGQDRIYDGWPDVALEMVASRTFDGRLQCLEYVPTVLSGPPDGG